MSLLTLPLRRKDLVVAAVALDELGRLWSSAPSRFARAYDLRDWEACGTHEVSPVGGAAGRRLGAACCRNKYVALHVYRSLEHTIEAHATFRQLDGVK